MRLWSVHPKYLDTKGLVALWREGLGALISIQGPHKGYHNHPQLDRFKAFKDPYLALQSYMQIIFEEGISRGYHFDGKKLKLKKEILKECIPVNSKQLEYEMSFLYKKMKERSIPYFSSKIKADVIEVHPIFFKKKGPIEAWEKIK